MDWQKAKPKMNGWKAGQMEGRQAGQMEEQRAGQIERRKTRQMKGWKAGQTEGRKAEHTKENHQKGERERYDFTYQIDTRITSRITHDVVVS